MTFRTRARALPNKLAALSTLPVHYSDAMARQSRETISIRTQTMEPGKKIGIASTVGARNWEKMPLRPALARIGSTEAKTKPNLLARRMRGGHETIWSYRFRERRPSDARRGM